MENTFVTTRIFNLLDFFLIATVAQLAIFVVLLLTRMYREKAREHYLLPGFILTRFLIVFFMLTAFNTPVREWLLGEYSDKIYFIYTPFFFLEGACLYWYIKSLIYSDFKFHYKDLVPLFLFVCFFLYQTPIQPGEEQRESVKYIAQTLWLFTVGNIITVVYGFMAMYSVYKYRILLHSVSSNLDDVDVAWLLQLVYMFLIDWLWRLSLAIIPNFDSLKESHAFFAHSYAIYGFFVVSIVFFLALHYSGIAIAAEESDTNLKSSKRRKKYTQEELVDKLEYAMKSDKLFTRQAISLQELADHIGIPPRSLSTVIHKEYSVSFFEFINRYRIEYAKELLSDQGEEFSDSSIVDIFESAGFKSKSTFNTLFKKTTGVTPTKYRKIQARNKFQTGSVEKDSFVRPEVTTPAIADDAAGSDRDPL